MRTSLPACFFVAALGCASPSDPTASDPSGATACADINLHVALGSPARRMSGRSGEKPSLAIDLRDVQADLTRVTVARCDGQAAQSREQPGGESFVLDASWYDQVVPPGCFRVEARAEKAGRLVGTAELVLRRGDRELAGKVTRSGGGPVAGATVEALVDDEWMATRSDEQGRYRLRHVRDGQLHLVRARRDAGLEQPPLAGEKAPFLHLDAEHAAVQVDLTVGEPLPRLDPFEPDDTPAAVQARAPLAASERHVLPDRDDVDVVPVWAVAGTSTLLTITPLGKNPLDLTVDLLASDGQTVVAHANGDADDFVPAPRLRFTPASTGLYFLSIHRRDDVEGDAAYDVARVTE